jgi:hypothetical protein
MSAVKKIEEEEQHTAENPVAKNKLPLQRFPSEKLYKSGGTGTMYVTHILLNSVGFYLSALIKSLLTNIWRREGRRKN